MIKENRVIDIKILCAKWAEIFKGYNYFYNPKMLTNSFTLVNPNDNLPDMVSAEFIQKVLYDEDFEHRNALLTNKDPNFFDFNVLAKEIRDKVNGVQTPINKLVNKD